MDEPTSRKRRIVRRAVMVLVVVVLLPFWYVGAWFAVSRAAYSGMIDAKTTLRLRPAFVPLILYSNDNFPGGVALRDLWWDVTGAPLFDTGPCHAAWNLMPDARPPLRTHYRGDLRAKR